MQWGEAGELRLQASDWSVQLGGRTLIQHMDLAVPATGSLAVLGESASDKSSLLRLLSGAMAGHPQLVQTGSAHYLGAPLAMGHAPPLVALSAKLLLASTFDALLEVVREQREHSRAEWTAWVAERLARWGFSELADHRDDTVFSLSPLHQRVVAIAREALAEPPVLLIDDPCKGLNDYDSFLLLDFVRSLSADMAVITALGQAREARHLHGHMLLLDRGEVVERGTVQDFLDDPATPEGRAFLLEGAVDFFLEVDEVDSWPDTRWGADGRGLPAQGAQTADAASHGEAASDAQVSHAQISDAQIGDAETRDTEARDAERRDMDRRGVDTLAESLHTQTPLIDMPSNLPGAPLRLPGEPLSWSQVANPGTAKAEAVAQALDALDTRADGGHPDHTPASLGPRGFYWLLPGQLAGMPLPGLVGDLLHDLVALKVCRIRQVISLSPQAIDPLVLAQHGIRGLHLAGTAGDLPTPAQLRMLVRAMARMIERGQGVAVHCVSGNGRTGLLLAAYLIHQGQDVDTALAQVRASNPAFRLVDAQRTLLLAMQDEGGPGQEQRQVA